VRLEGNASCTGKAHTCMYVLRTTFLSPVLSFTLQDYTSDHFLI